MKLPFNYDTLVHRSTFHKLKEWEKKITATTCFILTIVVKKISTSLVHRWGHDASSVFTWWTRCLELAKKIGILPWLGGISNCSQRNDSENETCRGNEDLGSSPPSYLWYFTVIFFLSLFCQLCIFLTYEMCSCALVEHLTQHRTCIWKALGSILGQVITLKSQLVWRRALYVYELLFDFPWKASG
jgi:hypothetical protein